MKRKFTILTAALALLAFLAIPMGMRGQTRSEVVAYTLDGTITATGNAYATATELTQNDITWMVTANTEMSPWRIGGKSLSEVDRPVYSTTPIADNITKIEVAHGTASGITVNSWTVIVASDASFTNVVSTLTPTFTASATTTINRPTGADWTGCYYKFIYNVTVTGTSNKFLQFVAADFYKQEGSGPVIATPTFDPAGGSYTTTQNVIISCDTEGSTIYYTTDGSTPDNTSTQYNGAITVSETTTINAIAYVGNDASSVATATYTIVSLEHAGTEADPYSVADARTAIDANVGVTGVYATGIVSAIPTAWSTDFNNITFNFVDNVGDNNFLQAYRCASGTGVDASTVAVGDVVVVYGNLIKYSSTYEFGQGCQLVSLTHPSVPSITVTPALVELNATGEEGAQMVTLSITCENIQVETEFAFGIQFYDAEGIEQDNPTWMVSGVNGTNDEGYFVNLTILDNYDEARSAYLKVHVSDNNGEEVYSNLVTVNQEAPELPHVTWNLSIDETATATEDEMTWTSDYATMAVEKGTSSTNTNNYYPGTSGHNYTSTRFYTGSVLTIAPVAGYAITSVEFTATTTGYASALMNSTWTNATASAEGTTVTITPSSGSGAIQATIGATCGFTQVKVYYEQHLAETYDLTISLNENIPFIFVFDANDQNNPLIEDGAAGTVQVLEGTSILVSPDVAEGYVLETLMVNNENVISQLDESGAYTFTMPAENVTISATAVEDVPQTPGEWVMVSLNDLTENDVFVIVGIYDEDESSFAMANNSTNAPSAVDVMMVGNTLSGDIAENLKWNLSIGEDGYTFYPNGETESWLFCNRTNNGVRVGTNENNVFTMTPEGYLFNNATSRYIGIYNRQDWRCYTSINNNIKDQTFAFYKRVDEGSLVTHTLDIEGYGDNDNPGGWYLIASPVSMIRPTFENGFLTDAYDLFIFDQAQDSLEWRNYKKKHFNIVSGKGYLYASQENTTLTFTGLLYSGDGEVTVTYDEEHMNGWNLIGNPFDMEAYLVDANNQGLACFIMNKARDGFIAATGAIAAMEGAFYQATPNDNSVYFSTDGPGAKKSHLSMTVNQGRGTVDNAIIRFGEGNILEKFSFREGSTKVYIPQDGKDYAVVNAETQGEMPVSFKAENNGTYSLSFSTENVEFGYLHLIDNLTGTDIDLLATPSYTFEANTTDYESRFRLVFSAETENASFVYYNGSEWVVNGNGTMQMVDMMGRVLSSETVNGIATVNTNGLSAGVYVMRLVNGNDVKTQKIVVR